MTRILIIIALLIAAPANALQLELYRSLEKADERIIDIYLRGINDGLIWGHSPRYCPPSNLAVNVDLIKGALEAGIQNFSIIENKEELYVPFLVVNGLSKMFPCEKK